MANDTITVQPSNFSPSALETVPEPSTVLFLAAGLGGLAGWRRRAL